jgi:hypothetical protein
MSIGLTYKDTVTIIKPVIDEYGTEQIEETHTVNGLFISRNSYSHASNQDNLDSDAEFYIDINNDFVIENYYRLEEMLIIANRFGTPNGDAWYKVVSVTVGEDKLLNNKIDNVLLRLKKTVGISYVS